MFKCLLITLYIYEAWAWAQCDRERDRQGWRVADRYS